MVNLELVFAQSSPSWLRKYLQNIILWYDANLTELQIETTKANVS